MVANSLQLPTQPDCTLCHTTNQGGPGTATKPFARTIQQFGVGAAQDPGLLSSALEQVKACKSDSDGDGVSDVDEITNRGDPNDGTGAPSSQCGDIYNGPLAETGCSVRAGAKDTSLHWFGAFAIAAAGLVLGEIRKRRTRPVR